MTRYVLFVLCIALVAGNGLSAVYAADQSLFLEAKMKSSFFGDMGTRRMWIKGDSMRWESITKDLKLIVVKNQQGTFLMHPWRKEAARYPTGSEKEQPGTYLPGPTGSVKTFLSSMKATKRASEKVGKDLCEVYSYVDPTSKRTCKLWVSTGSGKPVKLVLEGKGKTLDTITATYTKYEPGAKILDSQFKLPKGYVVRMMPDKKAAPEKRQEDKAT